MRKKKPMQMLMLVCPPKNCFGKKLSGYRPASPQTFENRKHQQHSYTFSSFIGPLIRKEIKKKMTKNFLIGPSVFTISVCVRHVCVSVSALQVIVFGVGSWFLAWRILVSIPKNDFFFLFFEILSFYLLMAIFRLFGSFLLYILS